MMTLPLRRWVGVGMVGVTGVIPLTSLIGATAQKTTAQAQPPIPTTLSPSLIAPSSSTVNIPSTTKFNLTFKQQPAAKQRSRAFNPESKISKSRAKSSTDLSSDAPTVTSTATVQQQIATPTSAFIRVRVASHSNQLQIATSAPSDILDADGKAVVSLNSNQLYSATIDSNGLQVGTQTIPNGALINPGSDGLTFVDGHWYRGVLQLVYDGESLLAVNWVDLEEYLYGAVGAEMPPSWNIEALCSQAIAARSYALSFLEQPASTYFDLGNDEYHQVYRGVEAETDSTIAAVDSTRAQVLTQNGRILMAQYASTDEVSREAHGGVGMSQTGAQNLAEAGYHHASILQTYYPSAQLSLLSTTSN